LLAAVQFIVPVPAFATARVAGDGDDPTGAKKSMVAGVTATTAVSDGVTLKETLTCATGPVDGVMVMVPV